MEIRPPDASERDAEIDEAARLWAAYEANRPGAPHDPLYGESQRRVGIGRALVGAFVAACQEQGVGALSLTVHETNAEAQRLYEATGWRWNASETVTTPVGDEVLRVMRLVL